MKTALITGAARGIGLATTDILCAQGWHVVMVDRDAEELMAQASERYAVTAAVHDISDPDQVDKMIAVTLAARGQIDALVNNAGVHRGGKVKRLADEAWHEVLQVNLTGAMTMTRAALAHMEAGSAIINVGAVVGFRGFPGDAAYASSKAGLAGLTKALAIELAPKDITANLVIPGLVLTEMTSGLTEASLEAMNKQIPMRRFAEEREIAEVVYWVSQSRYMTGACVPVDGGLLSSFGVT